ncbi:MAG: hypothetical protein AAB573_03970 [Patescibacteria group bacterium]
MPENKPLGTHVRINDIPIIPRSFLEEAIVGARTLAKSAPDLRHVTPATDPRILRSIDTDCGVIYSAEQDVDVETVRGRKARVTLNSYLLHRQAKNGRSEHATFKSGVFVGARRYRD